MAHIPFHPAPGLGELMPGMFTIPQNPITMARHGVTYTPTAAEVIPFKTRETNGLCKSFASIRGVGGGFGCGCGSLSACGCGGGGGCTAGCPGVAGMSGIFDDAQVWWRGWTAGIPNVWIIGGLAAAVLVLPMFMGAGGGKRGRQR
jgi:hypothetical protein